MTGLIFRKELKELFRTSKVVWMLAGIIVLILLSLFNGNSYYQHHSNLIKESQEVTYQQFISQGDKNPHLGAHFGFYAYKPTADLAMIENGIDDYTGNSFYLEPHKRGVVRFKEISDATGLRSFGFLNIGYLTEFILPLFIFLICHNIFSKEWENGTIKMLLSSKASSRQIFMGKLLSCLSMVMGIVLLIAISSLILLMKEGDAAGFINRALPAFVCYLAGLMLFATIITIIGVSVSLLTRSANLSLILLSGFWLIGVFLLPRLAGEVSKNIHPSTTSLEFENTTFNEKQYGVGDEGHKDARREALLQKTMKQYHVDRIEDLPVFFIPITIEFFEESDGLVMDRAYQAVDDNQANQDRLVLNSAWLTPFLAFRDFSMRITATDMKTHHDFASKAEAHRRKIGLIVDNYYQKNTVAGNAFWKTVPQFSYTAPGIGWRLSNAANSIVILLGWTIFAIALMLYAYRKMTV
jgi:ABC-2 type transport system permease protein